MLKKFNWYIAVLILASATLLTNCNDKKNELGLELQPANDKINVFTTDTVSVTSYSQIVDSVKTDETSVSMLGSLADPVFGVSTTNFYTQLRLGQTAYDFGTEPEIDSLVLSLDYEGIYGDSAALLTVKVYELSEQMFYDSSYFSNQVIAINETLLAQKTFIPDLKSDVVVLTDTLDPHLRINLTSITPSLAEKLLAAPADSMANNVSFLNYFYGLYVAAEPVSSGGAILYLNLISSLSKVTLYYHNSTEDSLSYTYVINANCARFGSFINDYSQGSSAFKAQLIDKDTALGNSVSYVQSLGGVKTFIRFPDIKNYYSDGKIAVNEARLFMSCLEPDPLLEIATTIIMVRKTAEGSYEFLADQSNGASYFGGSYDKYKHGYWFRITETIQELMRSDDPDYGFEIYLSGGAVNAQRVILHGADPILPEFQDDRLKLVLTYTKLN